MARGHGLRVIELPLTLRAPINPQDAAQLAAAIVGARAKGLSVVAGAGNNDDRQHPRLAGGDLDGSAACNAAPDALPAQRWPSAADPRWRRCGLGDPS